MKNREYSIPIVIAVLIHIAVIAALIMVAPVSSYRLDNASDTQPVIHASVVNSIQPAAREQELPQAKQAKQEQQQAQQLQKMQQLQAATEAARQAKAAEIQAQQQKQQAVQLLQAEQQRLAKLKAQQAAQARALELKKQAEAAKALELKKQAEATQAKALAAKKLRELAEKEKQAELAAKQQALQQQLMQQQLASDQQEIVHAQQMDGLIDIYRARILAAIGREWLIPEGTDRTISCTFVMDLTPEGVVTHTELVISSGNPALDRSAETAIYRASPLPLPKDPALYAKFKQLRLKMTPEAIVH